MTVLHDNGNSSLFVLDTHDLPGFWQRSVSINAGFALCDQFKRAKGLHKWCDLGTPRFKRNLVVGVEVDSIETVNSDGWRLCRVANTGAGPQSKSRH